MKYFELFLSKKGATNAVDIGKIMSKLEQNKKIKGMFHLKSTNELKKYLSELGLEHSSYLSWADFLDLLFAHKRAIKKTESPEVSPSKKEPKKKVIREIKEKEDPKRFQKWAISRKQSLPRAKSVRAKREIERSFNEGNIRDSVLTSMDYKRNQSVRDLREASVTIPKPFKFTERDASTKRKTIRQRKLEEMIEEKQIEEENMLNHQFRANKIPASTKMPRYEMIKEKNEQRRAEVKKNSIALTKAREKPFSFYDRDKDFYVNRAKATEKVIPDEIKNHKPFKATPIPWSVSAQLLDQMKEKEEKEREERVKKRAQELLALSKLPPRMEMHEMSKKQGTIIQQKPKSEEYSFQPARANPVPDFAMQHAILEQTLKKHKSLNKPTVVKPFEFRETKKKASIRQFMDQENIPQVDIKPKTAQTPRIAALEKPSINPPTTAKMVASMQKRRSELEKKRTQELKKQEEDKNRVEKLKKLGPKVRSQIKDNSEEFRRREKEKAEARQKAKEEREREIKEQMTRMEERINNRDLLMVQASTSIAQKKAKMENLKKIRDTMLASGIKDPERLFDPADQDLLREADLLGKTK